MTKISIIKSSSDLENEEIFPVFSLSYLKVWSSSDSDTEEEHNIDTDDPYSSDSDMLESLSSLVCILWQKIKLHVNTDFLVTGWMICVIPHICKDANNHSDSDHSKHVKNVIKTLFRRLSGDKTAVTQDILCTE